MNEMGPQVIFHLVDDAELPPMTINYNDKLEPVVYLNMHHKLWLALSRNTIPGIAMNLQNKLSLICDNHLTEEIRMSAWDDDNV